MKNQSIRKKISIIIASHNEPCTIGRAITSVCDSKYSGYEGDFELIQVSPDDETLNAGSKKISELGLKDRYIRLKDPKKGKSTALNMALDKATGEIIVMTDGDVYFDKNSLHELVKCFEDKRIGGVSGRPASYNEKNNFWGYISHLLTDAANAKRRELFNEEKNGYYTRQGAYFPMSGYILAYRNMGLRYDPEYIDDALISMKILSSGKQLAYAPKAKVLVKFPNNIKDYLLQRRRNFSGNKEIHEDSRFKGQKDPRSFTNELKFVFFPIRYARSIKELLWSLSLYPIRLMNWVIALVPDKKVREKKWGEISSTK